MNNGIATKVEYHMPGSIDCRWMSDYNIWYVYSWTRNTESKRMWDCEIGVGKTLGEAFENLALKVIEDGILKPDQMPK